MSGCHGDEFIYGTPLPDSLTMSTQPARIDSHEPRHFTSSRSSGASQLTVEDRMSTDEGRQRASAKSSGTARQYRRIAVEEAFLPPELMKLYLQMIADGTADDPGLVRKLERTPSEYLRNNVYVTTSGMAWEPAILFAHSVWGPDRLMYAMDYPYQYVPEEVAVTDHLPISLEDMRKLYRLNAERVFRLNEK